VGSRTDQLDKGGRLRIEVLGVVNQQITHPRSLAPQQIGVGRECRESRAHQLCGVDCGRGRLRCLQPDRPPQQTALLVLTVGLADRLPLRTLVPAAQRHQVLGPHTAFGGPHHHVPQCLCKSVGAQSRPQSRRPIAGPVLDVAGQELPQHRILLGAGDQARRRIVVCGRLQAKHRKRIGVHGANDRLAGGPRSAARSPGALSQQSGGDLLPQLGGCPPPGGQDQQRLRIDRRVGETGHRDVDDQRGLSRTRAAVNSQWVETR